MPLFSYECKDCQNTFDVLIIPGWDSFGEPKICNKCNGTNITKLVSMPSIRMDGRKGLRSVPDPTPPLQRLKEKGPRPGCEGGYQDLPEFKPTERRRDKDGNWVWTEKERKYIT